jgi:hypothetical protein
MLNSKEKGGKLFFYNNEIYVFFHQEMKMQGNEELSTCITLRK